MSAAWFATNLNPYATTIAEAETMPFYIVMSCSGVILERDDGEIREFRTQHAAQRAAEKLEGEHRG
jgi:hypothetical protein